MEKVQIGQELGGGVVFYVDATGQHGLITAKADLRDHYNWVMAKVTCDALGDGWRLPTKDELNQLYINRAVIGSFNSNNCYWSSTKYLDNHAWWQNLRNGFQYTNCTDNMLRVRPIRSF